MTPALRKAIARFLFDDGAPVMVDGTGIVPDPELEARNRERIRQARVALREKWVGWNPRPAVNDDDAENDAQTWAAHSHED